MEMLGLAPWWFLSRWQWPAVFLLCSLLVGWLFAGFIAATGDKPSRNSRLSNWMGSESWMFATLTALAGAVISGLLSLIFTVFPGPGSAVAYGPRSTVAVALANNTLNRVRQVVHQPTVTDPTWARNTADRLGALVYLPTVAKQIIPPAGWRLLAYQHMNASNGIGRTDVTGVILGWLRNPALTAPLLHGDVVFGADYVTPIGAHHKDLILVALVRGTGARASGVAAGRQ